MGEDNADESAQKIRSVRQERQKQFHGHLDPLRFVVSLQTLSLLGRFGRTVLVTAVEFLQGVKGHGSVHEEVQSHVDEEEMENLLNGTGFPVLRLLD